MGHKAEVLVNLRVPAAWLQRIDAAVNYRPVKTSRHTWIMEAIYRQMQDETVEGTLDIFWENSAERDTQPKYRLIFCRYADFQGGAMQPNRLVGDAALKRHLIEVGFRDEDAKAWMRKVKSDRSVPIPNVMMPMPYLESYGYPAEK